MRQGKNYSHTIKNITFLYRYGLYLGLHLIYSLSTHFELTQAYKRVAKQCLNRNTQQKVFRRYFRYEIELERQKKRQTIQAVPEFASSRSSLKSQFIFLLADHEVKNTMCQQHKDVIPLSAWSSLLWEEEITCVAEMHTVYPPSLTLFFFIFLFFFLHIDCLGFFVMRRAKGHQSLPLWCCWGRGQRLR